MADDPEGELINAFRTKAGLKDGSSFEVKHRDVSIQVNYSGGSSSNLSLRANYDRWAKRAPELTAQGGSYRSQPQRELRATRPLAITLRPELAADIVEKRRGVNVEFQSGDERFDAEVYVESPTHDPVILGAVLDEPVRDAVLELFSLGLRQIVIDDVTGHVSANLYEFTSTRAMPDRADRMLDAFGELIVSLPPVTASGEAHAAPPKAGLISGMLGVAIVLGFASVPILLGTASAFDCTEASSDGEGTSLTEACTPGLSLGLVLALLFGLALTALMRAVVAPGLRGRSDSARRIATLLLATFAVGAEIGFLVGSTALFALHARS